MPSAPDPSRGRNEARLQNNKGLIISAIRREYRAILGGVAVVALLVLTVRVLREDPEAGVDAAFEAAAPDPTALLDPDSDFPAVTRAWQFDFPRDHAAHPDFRTEAWSLSGVLGTGNGTTVALQLVILRLSLTDDAPPRESRWAASQAWAARLHLTGDSAADGVQSAQRASRGALGLAGASSDPLRVWVEDWRISGDLQSSGALNARLEIAAEDLRLDLALVNTGPLIDSGEFGDGDGNTDAPAPFVFYTQPFLEAEGSMSVGGDEKPVSGRVSMEHAWGELPLPGGAVSRDRFVLFMDDGRVLQLFRTQGVGVEAPATLGGFVLGRDSRPVALPNRSLELEPSKYRSSERAPIAYPLAWRLDVPKRGIRLLLSADNANSVSESPPFVWTGVADITDESGARLGHALIQTSGKSETVHDEEE